MTGSPRPRVWKAGHNCWAVTTTYYCEELGEMVYTTRLFTTWQQAINYAV